MSLGATLSIIGEAQLLQEAVGPLTFVEVAVCRAHRLMVMMTFLVRVCQGLGWTLQAVLNFVAPMAIGDVSDIQPDAHRFCGLYARTQIVLRRPDHDNVVGASEFERIGVP